VTALRAGYLPPGLACDAVAHATLDYSHWGERVTVSVPAPTPTQLTAATEHVREAARAMRRRLSTADVVTALDATIQRLLDRDDPARQALDRWMPVVTGYHADMVQQGLSRYLRRFRKPQLLRFLAEDFPNPSMLDGFQPLLKGGYGRACPSPLIAHIWAGNVPGLPLWSLVSGLLVKAGNVGKLPSAEPLFAGWFAQALAETAPALRDCLAVVWWRGGDVDTEQALLQAADRAVAYGNQASLAALRSRLPATTQLLEHGHRLSFAMIGREALDPAKAPVSARRVAEDVAWYDQQGCYSALAVFVERGAATPPEAFAAAIGQALAGLEQRFPRRRLLLEESAAIAAWRERAIAEGVAIGPDDGSWSVAIQSAPGALLPPCLNRAVQVLGVESLDEVPPLLARWRPLVQSVGVAAAPQRLFALADRLAESGVTRITALGTMSLPEAGWHHDGRFNLLDLVDISEIDQVAVDAADTLADDAD